MVKRIKKKSKIEKPLTAYKAILELIEERAKTDRYTSKKIIYWFTDKLRFSKKDTDKAMKRLKESGKIGFYRPTGWFIKQAQKNYNEENLDYDPSEDEDLEARW